MNLGHAIFARIDLYSHEETSSYISSYTTGDEIRGVVRVEPSFDIIPSDNIQTSLVPDILTQSSCIHTSVSATVKAAHTRPPPSFGDATTSGFGGQLRDDFAPTGCQISYFIQFQISRVSPLSGREEILFTKRQMLRIKPALDGTSIDSHPDLVQNEHCITRGEKAIYAIGKRQNKAQSIIGQLSAEIDEPFRIWLPSRDPDLLISQTARLTLFYQPCNWTANLTPTRPPLEIESFESQIVATTFFTKSAADARSGCYQPLAKREFLGKPMNFNEKRFSPFLREIPKTLRWDYQAETGAYTASLQVPVTLPRENFIPTFHSCLISRVYVLRCKLNLERGSGSIKLVVPLVISAKRDPAALPPYDASI